MRSPSGKLATALTVSFAAAVLLGACTTVRPLHAEPAALASLGPDEGLVVGSIRVDVAEDIGDGGPGRDARGFDYLLSMPGPRAEIDTTVFPDDWQLRVPVGEEVPFVGRLPIGHQTIGSVRPTPLFTSAFDVLASFDVVHGRPTYIGRLVVTVPPQLLSGVVAEVRIEEAATTTLADLAGAYGDHLASTHVALARLLSEQARLRTDPRY